jgi:Uma2 family endonuclease
MVARPHGRLLANDLWTTPDDGNRYEVIDGHLFVSPVPLIIHQRVLGNLGLPIWSYLDKHRIGELILGPFAAVLTEYDGVQPDLVYVSDERRSVLSDRAVEGPPDLIVEITDPSTVMRDTGVKRRRYADTGVAHYWLVDPPTRTLEVQQLGPDGYGAPVGYQSGEVFKPTLFPSLEIAVANLWT